MVYHGVMVFLDRGYEEYSTSQDISMQRPKQIKTMGTRGAAILIHPDPSCHLPATFRGHRHVVHRPGGRNVNGKERER